MTQPDVTPETAQDRVLVLGVGNLLLTDDGVGVLAAEALQERTWPANVTVREAGTFTQDVFYTFGGFAHILVLDVLHTGGEPGSIYLLDGEDLVRDEAQRLSIHDIDLLDSLRMAELYFGSRLRLTVLGMEPADITTWNIGLSPRLEAAFPAYLRIAGEAILRLAADPAATLRGVPAPAPASA